MSRGKEELQPASYGLDFKCRAISPLPTPASHDKAAITHRFVIGTSSLKSNKIHLLEYDESQHLLECIAVWAHDSEIAQLSASNSTTRTMFSVLHYNNSNNSSSGAGGDNSEVQIFALEGADETTMSSQHTLPISASNVLWDPNGDLESVVVVGTATGNPSVSVVKLSQSDSPAVSVNLSSSASSAAGGGGGDIRAVHGAARDPHHKDLLAVCHDKSIGIVDLRGKSSGVAVASAHQHAARSVDYNPNAMYRVISSGDDNTLKVWDLRKASTNIGNTSGSSSDAAAPLCIVHSLHDHPRINSVAYNPSHDELVLTGSVDHTARLWQFTDFSSSAKKLESSTNNNSAAAKILSAAPNAASESSSKGSAPTSQYQLAALQDFGDSVYKAAWSFQSPWVYGACSYNGKVLIHKVDPLLQRQLMLQGAEE